MWFTHRIKEQNSKIAKTHNSIGSKPFNTYERHDSHKTFQKLALKNFGESGVLMVKSICWIFANTIVQYQIMTNTEKYLKIEYLDIRIVEKVPRTNRILE